MILFPRFRFCLRAVANRATMSHDADQEVGMEVGVNATGVALSGADHPTEHREQKRHEAAGQLPRVGGGVGW